MAERKESGHKIFPTRVFTSDPVAFGALMAFQYAENPVSTEEAERLLFEETKGITCRNPEELKLFARDLDFWLGLSEAGEEWKPFRLYMNDRPVSLLGAQILFDLGCEFEPVVTKASTLRVHGERTPLPVMVELDGGISHKSLMGVKKFARHFALREDGSFKSAYHPQVDFNNAGWYYDKEGSTRHAEVWCFDPYNNISFKGQVIDAPFQVQAMLGEHWYTKRGGKFSDIAVWDLGPLKILLEHRGDEGHLVCRTPPAVLFRDELEAFNQGQDRIITDDHGCMYCVTYDAYFLRNDHLLRIWARMID